MEERPAVKTSAPDRFSECGPVIRGIILLVAAVAVLLLSAGLALLLPFQSKLAVFLLLAAVAAYIAWVAFTRPHSKIRKALTLIFYFVR